MDLGILDKLDYQLLIIASIIVSVIAVAITDYSPAHPYFYKDGTIKAIYKRSYFVLVVGSVVTFLLLAIEISNGAPYNWAQYALRFALTWMTTLLFYGLFSKPFIKGVKTLGLSMMQKIFKTDK